MEKNLYLKLNKEFQDFVVNIERKDNISNPDEKGIRYALHFSNGYGASIVKFFGSYGYEQDKWELALLKKNDEKWILDYDTEFAGGDVFGYLSDENVNKILEKIKAGKVNECIDIDVFEDWEE